MKVLLLDNSLDIECRGAWDLRAAMIGQGIEIHVRRGPEADFPHDPAAFAAVVLSGSRESCTSKAPWVLRELELLREWLARGTPILGVCFGHQLLARSIAGDAAVGGCGPREEYGWTPFKKIGKSRLLEGLPEEFFSFSSHREEIKSPPPGYVITLRSERCPIQAIESEDGQPFFGIQFHPERTLEGGRQTRIDRQSEGKEFLNPSAEKKYLEETAKTLFGNFFRIARG